MESKYLKEVLYRFRGTSSILFAPEQVEELIKDLEEKEKQDKILKDLLKDGNYRYDYDEWDGMRGNQYIMIYITDKDECFEEIKEMVEKWKVNMQ